ncbi:MAG: hypothetical protein U0Q11_26975 [Vicinamibacterales bacterium]
MLSSLRRPSLVVATLIVCARIGRPSRAHLTGAESRYTAEAGWGTLPPPLKRGEVPNVAIDPKGTVFVHRAPNRLAAVSTSAGKLVKTWGRRHVCLATASASIATAIPGSRTGAARTARARWSTSSTPTASKLLTLGTKGVSGDGPNEFNGVSDVAIALNGDIFVATNSCTVAS